MNCSATLGKSAKALQLIFNLQLKFLVVFFLSFALTGCGTSDDSASGDSISGALVDASTETDIEDYSVAMGDETATASLDWDGDSYIDVVFKTVDGTDVKLDIYLPEAAYGFATPVMIYSHGGGWRTGDKSYVAVGSRGQVAEAMLEAGVAVVSVDYRLSYDGVITMQDIIKDMKDAGRFVTKYADFYNVDPGMMLAFGDSAGGHIAQMTALASNTDENFIESEELSEYSDFTFVGAASWYGPVSFLSEDSSFFSDGGRNPWSFDYMIFIDETDTEIQEQARAIISPIEYYTVESPPLYLAHGDMDTTIPYYHLLGMKEHAETEGISDFSYTIVENAGHSFAAAVDGVDIDPTTDEIVAETTEKLLSYLPDSYLLITSDTQTTYWNGALVEELADEASSMFGVSEGTGGIVLVEVPEDSLAYSAGLRALDVIVEIADESVGTVETLLSQTASAAGAQLSVQYYRDQVASELTMYDYYYVTSEDSGSADFTSIPLLSEDDTIDFSGITTSPDTANEPVTTLYDHLLAENFGPVFPNETAEGIYEINFDGAQWVSVINTFSYNKGAVRGTQNFVLQGKTSDGEWVPLHGIYQTASESFLATQLMRTDAAVIGSFEAMRWVCYSVSDDEEHTAFQEFQVQ
jgi:acetyl esterase/lipase